MLHTIPCYMTGACYMNETFIDNPRSLAPWEWQAYVGFTISFISPISLFCRGSQTWRPECMRNRNECRRAGRIPGSLVSGYCRLVRFHWAPAEGGCFVKRPARSGSWFRQRFKASCWFVLSGPLGGGWCMNRSSKELGAGPLATKYSKQEWLSHH